MQFCGCYAINGKTPVVHLTCDVHVGYELYNDYAGENEKLYSEMFD